MLLFIGIVGLNDNVVNVLPELGRLARKTVYLSECTAPPCYIAMHFLNSKCLCITLYFAVLCLCLGLVLQATYFLIERSTLTADNPVEVHSNHM